jgi:hypothetical protein
MPYIELSNRDGFSAALSHVDRAVSAGCTPGDLNYIFTKIALSYLKARGLRYTMLNDVLGALEGAKLELYRRVVVPYEEGKLEENGDVYPR